MLLRVSHKQKEYNFNGKKIVDLDIFLDFIHEFSHAIFNSYKHKKRKITNLETDERMAYLIQEELIKKCFPEIYSSFIEYIYGLLLNNSLTFEFEDYIFSNFRKMDKSLEFKTQIFKRLLKKYVFPSNFSEKWIEDKNLFVLLFIVQFILEL